MFTYHRNWVAATFRALHRDDTEVTEEQLEQLDESLREMYDEEIRSQAADNGIATTKFNLSVLVFFSAMSRAKRVETRVKHGCAFFLSVVPQP